jgi:hypothetical protein
MKQVVAPNLILEGLSDQNRLPNGCNRQQLTPLGPVQLSEYQHCSVLDEIARVDEMDCEEDGLEDSSDDDGGSRSNSDNSGDESSVST